MRLLNAQSITFPQKAIMGSLKQIQGSAVPEILQSSRARIGSSHTPAQEANKNKDSKNSEEILVRKDLTTYRGCSVLAFRERPLQVTQCLQLSAFLLATWHWLLQLLLLPLQTEHPDVTPGTQHLRDRTAVFHLQQCYTCTVPNTPSYLDAATN